MLGNAFGEAGVERIREMMEAGGKEEALQSLSDDEGDEDEEEEEEEEEEERHDDSIKDEGTTDNGVSFWIKCLRCYNTYTCTYYVTYFMCATYFTFSYRLHWMNGWSHLQ